MAFFIWAFLGRDFASAKSSASVFSIVLGIFSSTGVSATGFSVCSAIFSSASVLILVLFSTKYVTKSLTPSLFWITLLPFDI